MYFSLQHPIKNFDIAIKGNYSLEEIVYGSRFGDYLIDTLISLEKAALIPSYPLNELDNYLLKFKRDFTKFTVFGHSILN